MSESEQRFGEFVVVRRHEHVAELVLDRPKAMNAVSTEMARSIAAACDALAADRGVRVTVLASTHERAFCVGADLK
jgi:enoyl-CoA hydratase/carnithine racemase